MKIPSRQDIMRLRLKYKNGMRVVLDHMSDRQAPPSGTKGTIKGVDDMGSVLVKWDTGSLLSLIPEIDEFHIIGQGKEEMEKNRYYVLCIDEDGKTQDVDILAYNKVDAKENVLKNHPTYDVKSVFSEPEMKYVN